MGIYGVFIAIAIAIIVSIIIIGLICIIYIAGESDHPEYRCKKKGKK